MRARTTAILLALAAAAGAYVYWVDQPREIERQRRERAEGALLDFSREEVRALEMPLEDGGRARVERVGRPGDEGPLWQLVNPVSAPAETPAVTGLLTGFERMRSEFQVEPDPEDLGIYGFDPERRVRIEPERGEAIWIALGDETPVANQRYVWLDGRRRGVFGVLEPQTAGLTATLYALRDKRMVDVDPRGVREVRVELGGELRVRAERQDGGDSREDGVPAEPRWTLLEPVQEEADHDRVARLVQDLYFARAEGFVDAPESLADYGLDPPTAVVELEGARERLARVELGRAGEQAYLRLGGVDGPVYEVANRLFENVTAGLFAYRQKRVLTIPEVGVERMELLFPREGARFTVLRAPDDEEWVQEGKDWHLREELVPGDLLFELYRLDAVERVERPDAAALGLEPPQLRVTLYDESGAVGWLELGAREPGRGIAARSSQSDRIWWLDEEFALVAPLDLAAFGARWGSPRAPADPDEQP